MPQGKSRTYEAVYIFDSALEDAAIGEKLTRHHGLLNASGDISVEHWGRRQLAYSIKRRESGYYAIAHFTLDDTRVLPEFERALKLDEGVVRYLVTLHEHEVGAPPMSEEEMAAAAARGSDEEED